ncbi:MAG: hypothetical protein IJU24_00365, partial [Bacteroidaceae bacterium]|nr:hypothetical protein [Bacteroidaceae bacterium]
VDYCPQYSFPFLPAFPPFYNKGWETAVVEQILHIDIITGSNLESPLSPYSRTALYQELDELSRLVDKYKHLAMVYIYQKWRL